MPYTQGVKIPRGVSPFNWAPDTNNRYGIELGERYEADDGRVWYWAKAAGAIDDVTTGAGGCLTQGPADLFAAIAATFLGVDTSTAPVAGCGGAVGDTIIRVNDIGTTAKSTGTCLNTAEQI